MRAVAKQATEEAERNEVALQKYRLEKAASVYMGWKFAITTAISTSTALVVAFLLPQVLFPPWSNLFPLLIVILPPGIAVTWQITKTSLRESKAEQSAKTYYLFDYDLSTLQSELEETLQILAKLQYRVIFVIDELDKMDYSDVVAIITSLKPLFNHAWALFVLISGDEFFKEILRKDKDRGTEYTLCEKRVYLRRPQFEEIRKFLDSIVNSEKDPQALIKLFDWNEIEGTPSLESFFKTSNDYGDLNNMKDAKNTKEGDSIIFRLQGKKEPFYLKKNSSLIIQL